MANIGDVVNVVSAQHSHIIKSIVDVSPIKYDGNEEQYVVCNHKDAKFTCITCLDIEGNEVMLLLPYSKAGDNCTNTYLLADAIQDS